MYVSLAELQAELRAMSITQLHRMRLVGRTTDAFTAFLTHGCARTAASSECGIVIRNSHSLKKRDGKTRRKRMNNN